MDDVQIINSFCDGIKKVDEATAEYDQCEHKIEFNQKCIDDYNEAIKRLEKENVDERKTLSKLATKRLKIAELSFNCAMRDGIVGYYEREKVSQFETTKMKRLNIKIETQQVNFQDYETFYECANRILYMKGIKPTDFTDNDSSSTGATSSRKLESRGKKLQKIGKAMLSIFPILKEEFLDDTTPEGSDS